MSTETPKPPQSPQAAQSNTIQPQTTSQVVQAPAPKKRGRKTGYRKPADLTNGVVSSEKIFTFIDRATIPITKLQQFLKICDVWITDLGADSLKDTDIEEVVLYARDRIYIDGIYKGFAEAETIDPNLITQLEKMNKGLEARKENLGARFKDRGIQRADKNKFSLITLFESFQEEPTAFLKQSADKKTDLEDHKETFSKVSDYMEGHVTSSTIIEHKDKADGDES